MIAENLIIEFNTKDNVRHTIKCKKTLGEGLSGLICTSEFKSEEIVVKFFGLTGDGEQIHVKSSLAPADIEEECSDNYITKPYNNMSDFILENAVLEHASKCQLVPEKKFSGITFVRDRAIPFIGSEFAKGKSIKQIVAFSENNSVSLKEKLLIMGNFLNGLSELHSIGVVNRDIKSAHVIVYENNKIKLLDYGASSLKGKTSKNKTDYKIINHEYNRGAWQVFTPWFLDPYRSKKAKPSNDIYSAGVIFGELITDTLLSSEISMDNVMMVARGKTLHGLAKYVKQPLYIKLKEFEKKGTIQKKIVKIIKSHFRHPIFRPDAKTLSSKCFQIASEI